MTKISIVLGSFNQKDVLKKVLDSFESQTLAKDAFEVIVVDSSSTDGTAELLKTYRPGYVFNPIIQANQGKAAARNRGVGEAKSKLILITDSDMIADPKLVETHLRAHEEHGKPASFEGLTYNLKRLEWPTTKENLVAYIRRDYPNKTKLGWFYFLTGNVSFPKTLFDEAGGFDTDFKGYGWEDIELGYRFYKKGIPNFYLRTAINFHYHVVGEEEEIKRSVDKGKSAAVLLKKHPELKWFLGCNPVSLFLHQRIRENGSVYSLIKRHFYESPSGVRHRFGTWFLKEHHYLTGIKAGLKSI